MWDLEDFCAAWHPIWSWHRHFRSGINKWHARLPKNLQHIMSEHNLRLGPMLVDHADRTLTQKRDQTSENVALQTVARVLTRWNHKPDEWLQSPIDPMKIHEHAKWIFWSPRVITIFYDAPPWKLWRALPSGHRQVGVKVQFLTGHLRATM